MDIAEFAERHRLRSRRDTDGTVIVPGRVGHIYQFDDIALAVMFMPSGSARPRLWHSLRDRCVAARMLLLQHGDAEGTLRFDPCDRVQAMLAIKVAGIRAVRKTSPAQLMNLTRGQRYGNSSTTTEAACVPWNAAPEPR